MSCSSSISMRWVVPTPPPQASLDPSKSSIQTIIHQFIKTPLYIRSSFYHLLPKTFSCTKTKATLDEKNKEPILFDTEEDDEQVQPNKFMLEVLESVRVLKTAAKTRKVPAKEILSAFSVIEKAKIDPSQFFQTLGGTNSPGRTWMLVFTAEKNLTGGNYFPITAVQRFDATAKRIENGVYLGLGYLTFEGRLSWKKRTLAFIFEKIRIKFGPLNPLEINIFKEKDDEREQNKKVDPFFIWFYIDEEIAVARGKSGGTAFWVRCQPKPAAEDNVVFEATEDLGYAFPQDFDR